MHAVESSTLSSRVPVEKLQGSRSIFVSWWCENGIGLRNQLVATWFVRIERLSLLLRHTLVVWKDAHTHTHIHKQRLSNSTPSSLGIEPLGWNEKYSGFDLRSSSRAIRFVLIPTYNCGLLDCSDFCSKLGSSPSSKFSSIFCFLNSFSLE